MRMIQMLRLVHQVMDKAILRASTAVLVRLVPLRGHGVFLRGRRWYGCWLGSKIADSTMVGDRIEKIYISVMDYMRADLELSGLPYRSVCIICAESNTGVEELVKQFGVRRRERYDDAEGLYAPDVRLILVSADPKSGRFCRILAHELCHAFCDGLSGTVEAPLWAFEGYGESIETALYGNAAVRHRRLRAMVFLWRSGRMLSIPTLLSLSSTSCDCQEREVFTLQAALFVDFLRSRRPRNPRVWRALKRALRGRIPGEMSSVDMLQDAFGEAPEQIERDFIQFCIARVRETQGWRAAQ